MLQSKNKIDNKMYLISGIFESTFKGVDMKDHKGGTFFAPPLRGSVNPDFVDCRKVGVA